MFNLFLNSLKTCEDLNLTPTELLLTKLIKVQLRLQVYYRLWINLKLFFFKIKKMLVTDNSKLLVLFILEMPMRLKSQNCQDSNFSCVPSLKFVTRNIFVTATVELDSNLSCVPCLKSVRKNILLSASVERMVPLKSYGVIFTEKFNIWQFNSVVELT